MDIETAREARAQGCGACVWWSDRADQEAAREFGECRIAPPRTSGHVRWPRTKSSEFCGSWAPARQVTPEQGGLAIGGRI